MSEYRELNTQREIPYLSATVLFSKVYTWSEVFDHDWYTSECRCFTVIIKSLCTNVFYCASKKTMNSFT